MSTNRQATKRQGAQKKAPKRQNYSSNQPKVRSAGGLARTQGNGQSQFAPQAKARRQATVDPDIKMSRNGTKCVIRQRELIDVIQSSSTAFTVRSRLRVNPASETTFPWLSTIARSFETYRFRKCNFQLIARAPTTTSGSVIMSPDYDAQDGAPTTEAAASSMKGTVEAAPWQDQTLRLDPAAMNRMYKAHVTMNDARFSATSQDEKTIDVAQIFVFLDLDSNSIKVGKLWVDYEVELFTPQPPEVAGDTGGGAMIVGVEADNPTNTSGFYKNSPASTTVYQDVSKPLFEVIDNSVVNSSNLVQFLRDWQGNVSWGYNNSSSTCFATVPTLYKNGVLIPSAAVNPQNFFNTVMNGASSGGNAYTTQRMVEAVKFLKGDILGLNPAGITGNFASAPNFIDSMLQFGANNAAWSLTVSNEPEDYRKGRKQALEF